MEGLEGEKRRNDGELREKYEKNGGGRQGKRIGRWPSRIWLS